MGNGVYLEKSGNDIVLLIREVNAIAIVCFVDDIPLSATTSECSNIITRQHMSP